VLIQPRKRKITFGDIVISDEISAISPYKEWCDAFDFMDTGTQSNVVLAIHTLVRW
jgi:hypothetical protein